MFESRFWISSSKTREARPTQRLSIRDFSRFLATFSTKHDGYTSDLAKSEEFSTRFGRNLTETDEISPNLGWI